MMNQILNRKKVTINEISREVAIKIEGNKMFGVLNNTRFVWDYTKYSRPTVEVKDKATQDKANTYGRLYILKRLELEGITLDVKTKERKVEYIEFPKKNGLWMNCFANGYIRGEMNGVAFAWYPALYKEAAAVNVAGFKGHIKDFVDTSKIVARLHQEGYHNVQDLLNSIKAKQVV